MVRITQVGLLVVFCAWATGSLGSDKKETEHAPSLHMALSLGELVYVQEALDRGADVHETNKLKETPLHVAASTGWLDAVNLLLEHGAEINARDSSGETPLHKASNSALEGYRVAAILIERGADINARNEQGRTPLHLMIANKDRDGISVLIAKGADGNAVDKEGWSLLHLAIRNGDSDLCRSLLENGASPDLPDPDGMIPIIVTLANKQDKIFKILIEYGAEINIRDKEEVSPLQIAADRWKWDLMKLLLTKGADPNLPGRHGETQLHRSARINDIERCKLLLRHGASPNLKDGFGWAPIHIAVEKGNQDLIKLLLGKGARVMARTNNDVTPLHLACLSDSKEIVELLIRKGANVQAKDNMGKTPMHYLSLRRCEMAYLLMSRGADIYARDNECNTPSCRWDGHLKYKSAWLDETKLSKNTGLFFSYDKLIHQSHIRPGIEGEHHKVHFKELSQADMDHGNKKLPFPSKLADRFFKIRTGFYVAAYEKSKMIFMDRISGFLAGWMGDYFEVSSGKSGGTFFVISKDRARLDRVAKSVVLGESSEEQAQAARRLIKTHFIEDLCDRHRLHAGFNLDDGRYGYDDEAAKKFARRLGKYIRMRTRTLDFNVDGFADFLVTGEARKKKYGYLNFTAIISGKNHKIIWIATHSIFNQVIIIHNRPYLLQNEYTYGKGEVWMSLYGFDGDKWDIVFSDGSYSD